MGRPDCGISPLSSNHRRQYAEGVAAEGLYDPAYEHDACGVGCLAHIHGHKSHALVEDGLLLLRNLQHRGACGCDQDTGDGAGILLQLPDNFFRGQARRYGIRLPAAGAYAAALVFLPDDADERQRCETALEQIVSQEGQALLGWRPVPVDSTVIGWLARSQEPVMKQLFIGRGPDVNNEEAFERVLYLIRRRAEIWAANESGLVDPLTCYVASCSSRTLVYKGMLKPDQLGRYFPDLRDPTLESALAVVHSRYSTNTMPQWALAHPFHFLAHNGEINTLKGNVYWLKARQAQMDSAVFGPDLARILPLQFTGLSDSATLDQAVGLLTRNGRSLPHALMMLVPEAYESQHGLDPARRAFYQYHSCLTEPWDGPASLVFTDGTQVGAMLDRNGLRPSRYVITTDDRFILASEAGVLPVAPDMVRLKGRLRPGRLIVVDTAAGRVLDDDEIKHEVCRKQPYSRWVEQNLLWLDDLPAADAVVSAYTPEETKSLRRAFGYTQEDDLRILLPMANDGKEPVSSMGSDIPLAVLGQRSQLLYNYFKQLFAQVTNPPIDSLREQVVMNTETLLGGEVNLLGETSEHARLLRLRSPFLPDEDLQRIRCLDRPGLLARTISILFARSDNEAGLSTALERICAEAGSAVAHGATILILSDRGVDAAHVAVPALLATAGVHHYLLRAALRTRCSLVVETGEAREIHHFALLIGYGAAAVNPYLALAAFRGREQDHVLLDKNGAPLALDVVIRNYRKAIDQGLLKIFSKMGISTLLSYRGAQIFEAVGLGRDLIARCFTGTPSRLGGVGLEVVAREALLRHESGFPNMAPAEEAESDVGGEYAWRRRGEHHMWNPEAIQKLQHAVNRRRYADYKEFSRVAGDESRQRCTLRGLLDIRPGKKAVPLELVEPAKEIVKRFCTGAMSFGSISREAHETLAIAMNRVGGKSNTGEGGEDPARFKPDPNGDSRNSAIKQVASGRFGVTANYLANAMELQIKIAQGAKPGEGGQLPGHKVDAAIAKTRYSTPGVGLISPPPHHDIYSIEDLAQLIFDLKNANPHAEVSVKLVAAAGVGTIAAGVAKGYADRILISGDSGGTGASPLSSIRHAGIPWELGLAETQQTLVRHGLRGRVRLQTDGQLKTGRDVIVAACLGAEEYGFSTAPLIAMGCVMMRKCHLNTCPVGIATQDPVLRARFTGTPEQVIDYLFFVAEEVREHLSQMGFRSLDEIVGRPDLLAPSPHIQDHWKARHLDLGPLLKPADGPHGPHGTPPRLRRTPAGRSRGATGLGTPEGLQAGVGTAGARPAVIHDHKPRPDGRRPAQLLRYQEVWRGRIARRFR